MPNQFDTQNDVAVSTLVGGIVQDARELMVEQLTLFQVEVKNDIHRMLAAFVPLGIGLAVALTALFLLGTCGAFYLTWQWPTLPLWAGFGIMGLAVAIVAGALVLWGKAMFDQVHLTPDTALKGLKENLQWKTKN